MTLQFWRIETRLLSFYYTSKKTVQGIFSEIILEANIWKIMEFFVHLIAIFLQK